MSKTNKRENEFEWQQFIKLGDMMGDGLHYEEPWIAKEYKRLSKILIPAIKKQETERRKKLNEAINIQVSNKLKTDRCSCGSKLKQTRSGSKVVKCLSVSCGKKYTYKPKRYKN